MAISTDRREDNEFDSESAHVHHVAITPWLPASAAASQTVPWTILPVRTAAGDSNAATRPHSSIQIPASSLALQSFSQTLHALAPNRTQRRDAPIEVRIHHVVPIGLDTVYVNLDTEALRKLDEVHAKFGGGFTDRSNGSIRGPKSRYLEVNGTKGKAKVDQSAQEQLWRQVLPTTLQQSQEVSPAEPQFTPQSLRQRHQRRALDRLLRLV